MIPYNEIRKTLVQGLKNVLGLPVINMNGGGDIPKGAFLTYSISDGPDLGGRIMKSQEGGRQILQESVGFTVSILSYADDNATSSINAMKARDWFKTAGYQALKDLDVIVSDIGVVQNRDVNIGEEWERRVGFDVDIRTTDTTDQPFIPIEKANIKRS
ncbi:phage neck terminator protein [Paenibacillus cellulositrophicus]|uniref:phage neck terminator protein n=1 Tax=Paenibacillus cellulositrophicus TaxID=562959 RepID=UPI003F7E2A92